MKIRHHSVSVLNEDKSPFLNNNHPFVPLLLFLSFCEMVNTRFILYLFGQ